MILENICPVAPSGVADLAGGADGGLKLGVLPNPARGSAVLRLELPAAGCSVRATIVDISGRLVRSLASGAMGPGTHYVPWDGRDSEGREVAPGIYLARVTTDGAAASQRIVMTR
ncbi:MAG: FlgD immunoglobulin-like domain containing protein [Candidatus Eisenbacteria bacterium]|nr:FlgD immunoglobulin-like domain containing protein [Candidatus Eisenbacteria bacterium]